MKLLYIKIVLLLCVFKMSGQQKVFGDVTIADLEQKFHPTDSSAAAAILYKTGDANIGYTNQGFTSDLNVKTRIKIYNKDGYEWANQNVFYRSGSNVYVSFSEVVTYNLVNGKIEKTKLKNDGEFEDKINKYFSQKKITLPNVKAGCIIEFKYNVKSYGASSPPKWNFQATIPVNYSELTTHIPEYLRCNNNQKGYILPKVTVQKKQRGNYEETITTYVAENFPAMKKEAFVNNVDNYTSGIMHEFSAYNLPSRTLTNFGKLASDWPTIAKTIYEYDDFGNELLKKGYFEKEVDSVTKGLAGRKEIITAVFNLVKNKVKWNKGYGFFCDDGVKSAYKTKTGNVAEINLMLTAMLRYLQLDADPVLISTRSNGFCLFPSMTAFDYVICGVKLPSETILLDATERFSGPNLLPSRDLNWFGRLIRDNGSTEQIDLLPTIMSKEVSQLSATLNDNGLIEGKMRKQFTEYAALDFREKTTGIHTDSYVENLENANKNIQIDDYRRENENNDLKPVTETFNFADSKAVEIINDKLYFSPMLFLAVNGNPFRQETREYPVDFNYPVQKKTTITIKIPDGYEVESMPANMNIATGESVGSFSYIIGKKENLLQLTINEEISTALVLASFYDVLKDFYQRTTDKQNEKIVLVKKI